MRQVTIRGVSDDLDERLKSLARAQGESVNSAVLRILELATGARSRRGHLHRYVTWTESDREEFEKALAAQRVVDDELWS